MHPDLLKHNHVTRDIKALGQCPMCDDAYGRDIEERLVTLYDINNNLRHANGRLKQAYEAEKKRHEESVAERDLAVFDAIALSQQMVKRERLATKGEVRLRTALERLVSELADDPIVERLRAVLDGYKETPDDEPDTR